MSALTDLGLLVLRVLGGLGIARHGYPKVFEAGMIDKMTASAREMGFPVPVVFAWAAALSELLGGILLALGLGTRVAAFFVFVTMGVAAFVRHKADPLGDKEMALLYWTIALALMLTGPGGLSLDRMLGRERGKK